jgi:hypothetical protein
MTSLLENYLHGLLFYRDFRDSKDIQDFHCIFYPHKALFYIEEGDTLILSIHGILGMLIKVHNLHHTYL